MHKPVLTIAAATLTGIFFAAPVQAQPCNGLDRRSPAPWNGQLMPTWNAPGFYGGWTTTPVICDQFTMRCNGYADGSAARPAQLKLGYVINPCGEHCDDGTATARLVSRPRRHESSTIFRRHDVGRSTRAI